MESNDELNKKLADLEMKKQEILDSKESINRRAIIEQCKDWWKSPDGLKARRNVEIYDGES